MGEAEKILGRFCLVVCMSCDYYGWYKANSLSGHTGCVNSVCLTAGGFIISGSSDTTVRIWNKTGAQPLVYRGHSSEVRQVCTASCGTIASGDSTGKLCFWDEQGTTRVLFGKQRGWITSLNVLDSDTITSLAHDGSVAVIHMDGSLSVFEISS